MLSWLNPSRKYENKAPAHWSGIQNRPKFNVIFLPYLLIEIHPLLTRSHKCHILFRSLITFLNNKPFPTLSACWKLKATNHWLPKNLSIRKSLNHLETSEWFVPGRKVARLPANWIDVVVSLSSRLIVGVIRKGINAIVFTMMCLNQCELCHRRRRASSSLETSAWIPRSTQVSYHRGISDSASFLVSRIQPKANSRGI